MSKVNNSKKATRRGKQRGTRSGFNSSERSTKRTLLVSIPRTLGWAAPRYRCNLRFHIFRNLTQLAATVANIRFEPTFAYDVDPTVGSTALPGFTELGALYRFYRVNGAMIKVRFSNNEAFPVECYICPVNVDPGANYNSTQAQTYLAQFLSKSTIIGPLTGNGVAELQDSQTTADFAGAANPQGVVDTYSGSVSGGAPSNNWFWTVGLVSQVAFTAALGVALRVEIDLDIEFFEIAAPSS